MKIAIIGAGVSGLLSLKYVLGLGIECDCFEETDTFGGIWVYTPKTNIDQNGLPIYRPMYTNVLTTLPKQFMTFSNFPYSQHIKNSYLTSSEVLHYLTEYVNHFNLEKHIQYYTTVTKVQVQEENKWMVSTENITTKISNSKLYDYVFVCSGHFRFPRIPVISNQSLYQGLQMHSQDYRTTNVCQNKRVLIVGGNISGKDIAKQAVGSAQTVFLSHWVQTEEKIEHVLNKPSVVQFKKNSVLFSDGSEENIDVVIYCTGYEYKFPFLSDQCGITTVDNWVRPLYKHVVNVERPTMMFIGITYLCAMFIVNEYQVQFAMELIKRKFALPSRQEMLNELENYVTNLKNKTGNSNHVHKIGFYQREYLSDLVKMANLKPFSPVLNKLFDDLLLYKYKIRKN